MFFLSFYFLCCAKNSGKRENFISNLKLDIIKEEKKLNVEKAIIDIKYLLGKIDARKDSLFVLVPREYCLYRDEYLLEEAYFSYVEMYKAAEKEGLYLKIISAFRSFDTQKWLWERKFSSQSIQENDVLKVLKYSSMPGTSRHHWGTDIDLCSLDPQWYEHNPQGKKIYNWLQKHANNFGFYQPYTANRKEGYNEEKWHWSYKKISIKYLYEYKKNIKPKNIIGFRGDYFCEKLNIIEKYVFSVDTTLQIK